MLLHFGLGWGGSIILMPILVVWFECPLGDHRRSDQWKHHSTIKNTFFIPHILRKICVYNTPSICYLLSIKGGFSCHFHPKVQMTNSRLKTGESLHRIMLDIKKKDIAYYNNKP